MMTYKVTIDNLRTEEELNKYHGLKKMMFEAGEAVRFFVITGTDTSYSVKSEQVTISCEQHNSGGITYYYFTMPDMDVEINISSYSTMMNPMMNGGINPGIPMMDMSMINTMYEASQKIFAPPTEPVNYSSVEEQDSFNWEGKPKFCSECGASTKGANRYCICCKTALKAIGQTTD